MLARKFTNINHFASTGLAEEHYMERVAYLLDTSVMEAQLALCEEIHKNDWRWPLLVVVEKGEVHAYSLWDENH